MVAYLCFWTIQILLIICCIIDSSGTQKYHRQHRVNNIKHQVGGQYLAFWHTYELPWPSTSFTLQTKKNFYLKAQYHILQSIMQAAASCYQHYLPHLLAVFLFLEIGNLRKQIKFLNQFLLYYYDWTQHKDGGYQILLLIGSYYPFSPNNKMRQRRAVVKAIINLML